MSFHVPNQYRFRSKSHPYGSDDSFGNNGAFYVPFESFQLKCLASDGEDWEHVSVSLDNRCPNWKEMCFIKDLFWDDEYIVVQYHPPKSQYVNYHPYCLHLWKPIKEKIPLPPAILVGLNLMKGKVKP